ncbi:hypothetical protein N657DRAFT_575998 [Parathielavia appendiculata]|uniref:Beta-ketoacyl synthase-like N-terminal domain-containing protein n=1 Tax=Parathielavia appendiculata TaxID=2587402 RepID=A0AAN6TWV0_9PEZI|nr:hypothetical protein N657DRAFT_575998 [Parathielavia appendiculata]
MPRAEGPLQHRHVVRPGPCQKHAHFLQELNLANIDPNCWSFTKQEVELLDPQQRLFLEVDYEALELTRGRRNGLVRILVFMLAR